MPRRKIALALGGGGAKGAYQIGVIKALEEAKLLRDINAAAGTSIGAINAMLLMTKANTEAMKNVWRVLDNEHVYADGRTRFKKDKLGLYPTQTIYHTLKQEASHEQIKKSKIDVYAVAAKIKEDATLISQIRKSKLEKSVFHLNTYRLPHRAVLASVSIPLLFGPTTLYGKRYVDGGMLDNHPIEPLVDLGHSVIFNVPLDRFFKPEKFYDKNILIIDFGSKKNFYRTRFVDLIDAMRFQTDRINERYEYGYLVGKKMIEKLLENGILDHDFGIRKPKGFTYITLSKKEDEAINYQIKLMIKEERSNARKNQSN